MTRYYNISARVSMAQTGSLNLFSNKEQEIDQKAGMLKRLAFTVFCSESDQYQKSIPEIQGTTFIEKTAAHSKANNMFPI